MTIAILPYRLKNVRDLANVPLDQLILPLEASIRQGTVRELLPEDHLVIPPSSQLLYHPFENVQCSISLRITEPYAVHRRHYLAMYVLWPRFFRIFSRCHKLRRRIPNARALTLTSTWVSDLNAANVSKTERMSLIASGKQKMRGHRIRHQLAAWVSQAGVEVDLLGRAFKTFDKKEEGLAPYRFSAVIENSREPGYFSEKLIDCLLCNTIPVYWGAPDVNQYFDTRGMVICQSINELKQALSSLNNSDFERLSAYSAENRERALSYINQEQAIAKMLQYELSSMSAA